MLWLSFPVHFRHPEICLRHSSVHKGREAIQQCLREENGISDICRVRGLNFSLYSQTIHASTPPAYSSLRAGWACLLAAAVAAASSSLCAPDPRCCIPARTDSHMHLFLAVDFQNLVHLLENYLLPWWYSGFTQSHRVKQRWRASVYSLGHKDLSIFALLAHKNTELLVLS